MSRDYYDIVGVTRTASDSEIKRAFRRKARELHPDVNARPDAEARFKELNAAYQVLSDPVRRSVYDRMGGPRPNPPQPSSYRPRPPHSYRPDPGSAHGASDFSRQWEEMPVSRLRLIWHLVSVLARANMTSWFTWCWIMLAMIGVLILTSDARHWGLIAFVAILACPVVFILSVIDTNRLLSGQPRKSMLPLVLGIVGFVLFFAVIPFGPPMLILQYAQDRQIEWLTTVSYGWIFIMLFGGEIVAGVILSFTALGAWRKLNQKREHPGADMR